MPEELRDCPMGEFPMLAPELISMLRNKRLGHALIELRCCADEIHDAGFEPDDEILAIAKSRVPTSSLSPKSLPV